jgi:hypothetical protein
VVLLLRRPVVVLGRGHPPEDTPGDGYFQRVRLIDRELEERWRIYPCFERPADAGLLLPAIRMPTPRSYEICCRPRNLLHNAVLLGIVLLSGRIYVHSVLRLADGISSLLYRLARRAVFDVHGVVPEEFTYHGDEANAGRFDALERLAVQRANLLVVVTRAMQRHLVAKHGEPKAPFACMPMMPRCGAPSGADGARQGVVYCGGLHKWQQLDRMLAYVQAHRDQTRFCFLVTDPDAVRARHRELFGAEFPGEVSTVAAAEVDARERDHAFGLVLRQDNVVNRVACPTKLVEYLHNGLVPILESAQVGDFAELGLQYVAVDAPLPDAAGRLAMAAHNAAVLRRLRCDYALGAAALRAHL